MSDLRKQVRDHYDAQSLPADKLEAILARGRDAASGAEKSLPFPQKKSWARFISAVAALIVFALVGVWWTTRDVGEVSYTALAPRVIEFFQTKSELLPPVEDKKELHDWLVSKGAPADFVIPASLQSLESAACQVVDVKGRNAYLSCYWRETRADRGPHELIHLLVARTDDFYDQPKSAAPQVKELDGWSFASWTKGDAIYTLATAAPKEKLMPFLASAGLLNTERRHTAAADQAESSAMLSLILEGE